MLNDVVLLPDMPELRTTKKGLTEIDEVIRPGGAFFKEEKDNRAKSGTGRSYSQGRDVQFPTAL